MIKLKSSFEKYRGLLVFAALLGAVLVFAALRVAALDVVSGEGLLVYGLTANTTPQWRAYNAAGASFGSQTATVAGATGVAFTVRTSPTKQEAIAGYVNTSGQLQVMCYDGANWTNEWTASVGGTDTTRRFDISYETNSGDVIVLYSANAATTNELTYRTKAGSAGCGGGNWSGATSLDPVRTSGIVHWVKLAWDRRSSSNLVAAVWADANSDLSAMTWSGTAWGNEPGAALETSLEVVGAAQDVDNFDVEYESTSADILVVWGNSAGANGTNGVRYATCTGGTAACTWSAVATPPTFADDATNLDISANPNNNEIVFASIGNAGSDLQLGYWSGTAWTNTANVDTSSDTPFAGSQMVATTWLTSGATTRSLVVYSDVSNPQGNRRVNFYTGNGGTFTAQSDFNATPNLTATVSGWQLRQDPLNQDSAILALVDGGSNIHAKRVVMDSTPNFTWSNADGGSLGKASAYSWMAADYAYWRFIPSPAFDQSAYRFFANANSTDVGTPLAAQDTPVSLSSAGQQFRLRMLVHISDNQLLQNNGVFKLQYAEKGGGSCSAPSGTPGTYTDVTAATSIAYYNNGAPADGSPLTPNANDPTHSGHTIVGQTYEELNNLTNSQAAVPSGQDALWDFSLFDNGAAALTTYCFRLVTSSGTPLSAYSVYPEVTTFGTGALGVDIVDSGGTPVGSPSFAFNAASVSFNCITRTGTFGGNNQRIRVTNTTGTPGWILNVAATAATNTWNAGGGLEYDFNDPSGSGCTDGGDADSFAGQLTLDASAATITPQGGCANTGLTAASATAFNQGTQDTIALITADNTAQTGCYWDVTGISLSQTIPAEQPPGNYALNIVVTVIAN